MRAVRCVVRALGALLAVSATVPGLLLALPSAPASAAPPRQPLAISITGMTPSVRDRGRHHQAERHAGQPHRVGRHRDQRAGRDGPVDLQRPLRDERLHQRRHLPVPDAVMQAAADVTGTVGDGETVHWSANFPADNFYDQFGVFPVKVAGHHSRRPVPGDTRTFLPYWPSQAASQPKKLTHRVGVAAGRRAAAGRLLPDADRRRSSPARWRAAAGLATLLDAGSAWAKNDDLTWDIDPALLSDVSVMTQPLLHAGQRHVCSGRTRAAAEPGGRRLAGQAEDDHGRRARLHDPIRQRGRGHAEPCRPRRQPPVGLPARQAGGRPDAAADVRHRWPRRGETRRY